MLNICPNCHYFGEDKHDFSPDNFLYGLLMAIFGLLSLLATFALDKAIMYKLVALLFLIGGIVIISAYFKGRVCPNCNYKEMLPIDDPGAIEIIKKHDLKPGDNPPPSPETSI